MPQSPGGEYVQVRAARGQRDFQDRTWPRCRDGGRKLGRLPKHVDETHGHERRRVTESDDSLLQDFSAGGNKRIGDSANHAHRTRHKCGIRQIDAAAKDRRNRR